MTSISVSIPEDVLEKLKSKARDNNMTMSELLYISALTWHSRSLKKGAHRNGNKNAL